MTKIFVSYRRDDSADTADLIVTHLTEIARAFPTDDVFFDVESIPIGVNVRNYIIERVSQCVVMLVIVGTEWATIKGRDGKPRLHNPNDTVRLEVETALKRGISLIPVMVRGAEVPNLDDLPESLRELFNFNGLEVRRAPNFKTDMARLIFALERIVGTRNGASVVPASTAPPPDPTKFVLLRTLSHESRFVLSCAISPDGRYLVSAPMDGTLRIHDFASGHELRALTGHTGMVRDCAISPDGRWIVSASEDETLKIWNAADGRELRTLSGHSKWVTACAISPNGHWIFSASYDKTLKIWNAADGHELRTLSGHSGEVDSCAISTNGRWIVSASSDKTLKIWDAGNGRELRTLSGHKGWVNNCAISPDGNWIASTGQDGTLKVWEVSNGQEIHNMMFSEKETMAACAISPDGQWIVSTPGKNVCIWNRATGRLLHTYSSHTSGVFACDISRDGRYIVSAAADHTLKIWGMPGT